MKSALKIFILLLVILGSSCKKDFKETQQKTISLTKPKGWLILKMEEKSNTSTAWEDITANISPLVVDNVLIFDPWFKWAINEGALKFPGDPQISASGTWQFTDNATKIQIVGGNLMDIVELTDTKLVTIVTTNGASLRYTYGHP
jgi:hypothetical protein